MKTLNPQPSTRSLVWPPCPTICHRRQFFSSANRSNSPSAPTNTRNKSQKTIHFSFRGLIWLAQLAAKQITAIRIAEVEEADAANPQFQSLDAFRPLGERAPDPQIAEAQRREFFNQLHRWLRQGHAVHVFCNNDGERQRFGEIWNETNPSPQSAVRGPQSDSDDLRTVDCGLWTHIGTLARGFFFAKKQNLSSSPTRKFSAATKFSGRAG